MPPERGAFIDGVVRQSTLRIYDQCPRRAVLEARDAAEYTSGPASLGTAFHMVAEEMLRTLRQQGAVSIPTQEAIEILMEVVARPDCPHLTVEMLRELRVLVLQFAVLEWAAPRIIALEQRLSAEVPCPDGTKRRITGKPDVLIADPPGGAICLDFKVSWAVPPSPRNEDNVRDHGRPYLSERGHFQLDTLGLLIMRTYPAIMRVTLREYYPRLNEVREATLERDELEHVERRLGVLAQRFEADMELKEPEPRPGRWCSHCPVSRTCPVPHEARGPGALDDDAAADAEAARYVMVEGLRKALRTTLKAYHEETGHAPAVGDGTVLRWKDKTGGGRSFDVWPPITEEDENGRADAGDVGGADGDRGGQQQPG